MTLKLSLIAPNFNEEKHLPLFLESLKAQSFKDFELIVVDGDSTDSSRKIIDSYRSQLDILGIINPVRNIGFIRNLGSKCSRTNILFHSNTDTYFPSNVLEKTYTYFQNDPHLISVCGRTQALDGSVFCNLSYVAYDFLRWFFLWFNKFRPGGSFFSIKTNVFWKLGGFPEVPINEDGYLGRKIDPYLKHNAVKCTFDWNLHVDHHAGKRWKESSLKGFKHYVYVFGNFVDLKVFKILEAEAAARFKDKKLIK